MSSSLSVLFEPLGPIASGAKVIAIVAAVDLVVVSLLLFHMLLTIIVPSYTRRVVGSQERKLLTSPLGMAIICLFIGNFIFALGGVFQIQWILLQAIEQGPICSTQAFLFQLGGNASSVWLGIISLFALRTFMFRARPLRTWVVLLMMGILWTGMIVFDIMASTIFAAGGSKPFFYGPAGLSCWITPTYRMARVFTQFFWMWFWCLVSAICFALVFLCVRGIIIVKKDASGTQIKWDKSSWRVKPEFYEGIAGVVGKTMSWFPIGYITLVIPISVTQVAATFGFPVPIYAGVFAVVNSLLIGIVNVIIYLALRHSLKRAAGLADQENTPRGTYSKFGAESFEALQEKGPSKQNIYPWMGEWVPPSDDSGDTSSQGVAYVVTGGDDRSSIFSNAPPRQVPVSTKLAQRSRSFHRPLQSISTDTGSATALDNTSQSDISRPRPALLTRNLNRSSVNPSPNIVSPSELQKLTYAQPTYTGSRSEAKHAGPPPPPRKKKRALTPSVPMDVDESDMGSFSVASEAPVEDLDRDDNGRVSLGDITRTPARPKDSIHTWASYDQSSPRSADMPASGPSKTRDTMRTFWTAYDSSSPRTPDMPTGPDGLRRDTMRSFWAAYETPSPRTPNMPSYAVSPRNEAWNSASRSPEGFRHNESAVNLKPSISAVAAQADKDRSPRPAIKDKLPGVLKPTAALRPNPAHRRSRSFPNAPETSESSTGRPPRPQRGFV